MMLSSNSIYISGTLLFRLRSCSHFTCVNCETVIVTSLYFLIGFDCWLDLWMVVVLQDGWMSLGRMLVLGLVMVGNQLLRRDAGRNRRCTWHVAMALVDGRGPEEAPAKRGPGR